MAASFVAVFLVLTIATRCHAQALTWLHPTVSGGAAFPVASNPDRLGTGFQLQAGAEIGRPHSPLALRLDGLYERFPAGYRAETYPCAYPGCGESASRPGTERIAAATLNVIVQPLAGRSPLLPYGMAGVGAFHTSNDGSGGVRLSEREGTRAGWNLGAGLRLTPLHLFVEARVLAVRNARYLPVTVGFRF